MEQFHFLQFTLQTHCLQWRQQGLQQCVCGMCIVVVARANGTQWTRATHATNGLVLMITSPFAVAAPRSSLKITTRA